MFPLNQDGRQQAEDDKQTLTGIKAASALWAHSRQLNAMRLCGGKRLIRMHDRIRIQRVRM
jgi:hypothetical protein